MAKQAVVCVRDYIHTIPESLLETIINGEVVSSMIVPEKVFTYKAGQTIEFGSVKSAKGFISAHGDVFRLSGK
jgi:hypothetical protein